MLEDATKVLKDALYVSVGLGVIAFQKAQVQRQELQKAVEERLKPARHRPLSARRYGATTTARARSRPGQRGAGRHGSSLGRDHGAAAGDRR